MKISVRIFSIAIAEVMLLWVSVVMMSAGERGYVPDAGRFVSPDMVVVAEEDRGDYVCKMIEFTVDDSYVKARGRKIRS